MMRAIQSSASSLQQSHTDTLFLPLGFLLEADSVCASIPQNNQPQNNQSNRCLAHCWLDDDQRDQGQRCLVACWQSAHHGCSHACATHSSGAERSHHEGHSHQCHSC